MAYSLRFLPALLALIPFVAAHGFVKTLTIDGKSYEGNEPNEQQPEPKDSPIRQIATVSPITSTQDAGLACGKGAPPAALTVPANPGSNVSFDWASIGTQYNGLWFHEMGPIMTYMAPCEGESSCDTFNASDAKWFKIAQAGQKPGSSMEWYQKDLTTGEPYSVLIPDNLKAGPYLIRNEIIALHTAQSRNGAEFYPSCSQLNITGNGNGVPNTTVTFPGAYSADDPGILVNVYTAGLKYQFPGGYVASIVSDGGGNDDTGGTSAAASSSETSTSQASSSISLDDTTTATSTEASTTVVEAIGTGASGDQDSTSQTTSATSTTALGTSSQSANTAGGCTCGGSTSSTPTALPSSSVAASPCDGTSSSSTQESSAVTPATKTSLSERRTFPKMIRERMLRRA